MRALAYLRRSIHKSSRVHSWRILRRLIKHLECTRKVEIGILAAQYRGFKRRKVFGNDYRRCLRGSRQRRILGIRDKGEVPGPSRLDASHARDFGIGRAVIETGAKCDGNVAEFHGKSVNDCKGDALLSRASVARSLL